MIVRMAGKIVVDDGTGLVPPSELNVDLGPNSIDQDRADIRRNGFQYGECVFESALPGRIHPHAKTSHRVVRVQIDRSSHVPLGLVQQADVRIHHRQLMVCLVGVGIELKGFLERSDGLLVRKSLRLRPQNEAAGEVRLGEVWLQIQCLGQRDVGVVAKALAFAL